MSWIAAVGLAFAALALVVQVVVVHYSQAAVRRAVDEGARAGAALGSEPSACRQRAVEVLRGPHGVLRGALGREIHVECEIDDAPDPPHVVVVARGELSLGFPFFRSVPLQVHTRSVVEQPP